MFNSSPRCKINKEPKITSNGSCNTSFSRIQSRSEQVGRIVHSILCSLVQVGNDSCTVQLVVSLSPGSAAQQLILQPPSKDDPRDLHVVQILGGGATPFRVWTALQCLLLGQGVAHSLMQEVLSPGNPEHSQQIGSLGGSWGLYPRLGSLNSAASGETNEQSCTEAIELYCREVAQLNESQLRAVLQAAAPGSRAQQQITLIQVRFLLSMYISRNINQFKKCV